MLEPEAQWGWGLESWQLVGVEPNVRQILMRCDVMHMTSQCFSGGAHTTRTNGVTDARRTHNDALKQKQQKPTHTRWCLEPESMASGCSVSSFCEVAGRGSWVRLFVSKAVYWGHLLKLFGAVVE